MDSKSRDSSNSPPTLDDSSKPIDNKRIGLAELSVGKGEPASDEDLELAEALRPKTRADCVRVPRPCPYVSCRYNLYFDEIFPGLYRSNYSGWDPKVLDRYMCALDYAHEGGMTLEETGQRFRLTRERVRQIEERALDKIRKYAAKTSGLSDFQTKYVGREALASLLVPAKKKKRIGET